jgi:hypothetical protein
VHWVRIKVSDPWLAYTSARPSREKGSLLIGWAGSCERLGSYTNPILVDSRARRHCELAGFLLQLCLVRGQRHVVLLVRMVAGLLMSETVWFDRW